MANTASPGCSSTVIVAPNTVDTTTFAAAARIPALAPVSMMPRRTSRAPLPSALLDTIDAVEINRTVERDGITYFVLDVYLKRFTSRIPTNLQKEKQRQLKHQQVSSSSSSTASSAAAAATPSASTSTSKSSKATITQQSQHQKPAQSLLSSSRCQRTPDYQLEKRFSDFADLRYHVWVHAQQSEAACAFSNAFMDFIVHSLSQPRLVVRLATTTGMRKKLLTTFCNEFLRLSTNGCDATAITGSRHRDAHANECEARHAIPILLERFFRKQEGAAQQ